MMNCLTPFFVKNENGDEVPVPCRKCPMCIKARVSGWSFRLMQQMKVSRTAAFITLTYNNTYVPRTKNGFLTLNRKHVQDYHKRLRKAMFGNKGGDLKYYLAGEYGGGKKYGRPHYHIIYFNVDISMISAAWAIYDRKLDKYFSLGNVDYGDERGVTAASVGYTLKYVTKPQKVPLHRNDDREPEFSMMSKGLGKNYLTKAMIKWHKADLENRMYISLDGGKKASMPRYYKDKIYTEDELEVINYVQMKKGIDEFNKVVAKEGRMHQHNREQAKAAAFDRAKHLSSQRQKL